MNEFDSLVESNAEEDKVTVGGMDNVEMVQFYKFIMGQASTPPEIVTKMMNNLVMKLSMGLGYNVVNNISRQADLSKFLAEAEKRLFSVEALDTMTTKEIQDAYKEGRATLTGLQEFQRKFIVQNKETLKTDNTPQEKLMNKIMTLSPDKVAKLMETIETMSKPEAPVASEGLDESIDIN